MGERSTRYWKIREIKFTIAENSQDKNWVKVIFENGTHWKPAFIDLGDILSKIGKCEDIKYPNGKGWRMVAEFINECFNKTRTEIKQLYDYKFMSKKHH